MLPQHGYCIPWERDFPRGFGHTSIAYLKRCIGYAEAKDGSREAADFVVSRCIKRDRIVQLAEKYKDAYLLPVGSESNMLPIALAESIPLPVYSGVRCISCEKRKAMNAMQRLLHCPMFVGDIPAGLKFIIVDDIVTQGGVVAALRQYVHLHGSTVVAVTALAFCFGSHIFAPFISQLHRVQMKFGDKLGKYLFYRRICMSYSCLTYSHIRYLLNFKNLDSIIKRIEGVIPLFFVAHGAVPLIRFTKT